MSWQERNIACFGIYPCFNCLPLPLSKDLHECEHSAKWILPTTDLSVLEHHQVCFSWWQISTSAQTYSERVQSCQVEHVEFVARLSVSPVSIIHTGQSHHRRWRHWSVSIPQVAPSPGLIIGVFMQMLFRRDNSHFGGARCQFRVPRIIISDSRKT